MIHAIILAGGDGTRLFPLSRKNYPKQFLSFGNESFIQMAYRLARTICKPENIYIVCRKEHEYIVSFHINDYGWHLVVEPCGKGTLPAAILAANTIRMKKGNVPILILPSDHYISLGFIKYISDSLKYVGNKMVIFGVKPTSLSSSAPSSSFGYIKVNENGDVISFVEKPSIEIAKRLMSDHYVNMGIIFTTVDVFLDQVDIFHPELIPLDYKWIENPISIDHGLLEHSNELKMVVVDTFWKDMGDFSALYEVSKKDENENTGDPVAIDSRRNYVNADKTVCLIGVNDLVVVDTRDALLVCNRKDSNRVKEIAGKVKDSLFEESLKVYRPWGYYSVLESGKGYKIKRVHINPHSRLSLQYHMHRSEHWTVLNGCPTIELDGIRYTLVSGESMFSKKTQKHRLINSSDSPVDIIEIQYGDVLEETDIIRLEDDYNRN